MGRIPPYILGFSDPKLREHRAETRTAAQSRATSPGFSRGQRREKKLSGKIILQNQQYKTSSTMRRPKCRFSVQQCNYPQGTSIPGSSVLLEGKRQAATESDLYTKQTEYRALLYLLNRRQTQTGHSLPKAALQTPGPALCSRGLGGEKGMRQTEEGRGPVPSWARMACSLTCVGGSPFQRKPEGLAQSPGAPGKQCSRLPSANSKAGWLSGSADLLENS